MVSGAAVAVAVVALSACGVPPPAAVPPPLAQTSANCAAPTYATDAFVCADPHLRALDAELATLWAAIDADPHTTVEERDAQEAWFRQRSACAFESDQAACVESAYRARIDTLRRALRR